MATPFAAFALTYLLAVAFTDELSMNMSYTERLVTYRQNLDFTAPIPGVLYNGTIDVDWAVPPAALSGIGVEELAVKVTASAHENSSVFFPVGDAQAKEYVAYLQCKIENGTCANGSTLSVVIPVATLAKANATSGIKITLLSEIVPSVPITHSLGLQNADTAFESLKHLFSQNASANVSLLQDSAADMLGLGNFSFPTVEPDNSTQNGNFLDSLKPEGDSRDPLSFLRENPLISVSALIIVIVITGAYLLNAKD